MLYLNPAFKFPWFEQPQPEKDKEPETNNETNLGLGFLENFRDRLATAGVFQGEVVNVDYSDLKGFVKRVIGAPLTLIGGNFIELSAPAPFGILTLIPNMPGFPSMELVRTVIIPISSILDVRVV